MEKYDKIIIGAGLYGLYAALFCCQQKQNILVLECDSSAFKRATYINQARVHQGYHYPRSLSTAARSINYFKRFNSDYNFCINKEFDKIYATSKEYSWTTGRQFKNFCNAAGILCEELHPGRFFKYGMCDGENFIYDFIHRIPSMLTENKFHELTKTDKELYKFYNLQNNGFYKVKTLSNNDRLILKKKFESLNFSSLNFTDSRSVYQFYNLERLWDDIKIALNNNITL